MSLPGFVRVYVFVCLTYDNSKISNLLIRNFVWPMLIGQRQIE